MELANAQEAPGGVTIAAGMSLWIKLILYGAGALGGSILIALMLGLARNLTAGHRMLLSGLVGMEVWALAVGPLKPAMSAMRVTFGMDTESEAGVFGAAVMAAVVLPTIALYGVVVPNNKRFDPSNARAGKYKDSIWWDAEYTAAGLQKPARSSDKLIDTIDGDGVALAAIQGLNTELQERLAEKDAEIAENKAEITQLEARLERLEALAMSQ